MEVLWRHDASGCIVCYCESEFFLWIFSNPIREPAGCREYFSGFSGLCGRKTVLYCVPVCLFTNYFTIENGTEKKIFGKDHRESFGGRLCLDSRAAWRRADRKKL